MLKCDISKFFASIDHEILKQKLAKRIKDKEALKIVFDLIDSNEQGLYIGYMANQILAIFYLNDLDKFIKEKLNIEDEFELKKEKSLKHGRMDLFAISKDKAIIIENKIQSGLNGIDKDEGTSQLKNYIEGINKDYKIDENKIYGVIFIPDYNVNFLNKEMQKHEKKEIIKYYTPITYSELFEFFNRKEIIRMLKKDLYFNGYYEDFLRCIKNHTFSNISEKNKTEMERKFIYAIKKALEN